MKSLMFSLMLILLGGLAGCVTNHSAGERHAWLKPRVAIVLPSPQISPPIHRQQLLTATIKGKAHNLLVLLDADEEKLSLVGLSTLGIRLFTLTYRPDSIETEQSIVMPELPPATQVLADIMLSYWPLIDWQSSLPTGWTLRDEALTRILLDKQGQAVITIDYAVEKGERKPIKLTHHIFAYQIAIQDLEDPS